LKLKRAASGKED